MLGIQYLIQHKWLASHYQEFITFYRTVNVRKISARWVLHLLTDGQKKQRIKKAKQLLKICLKNEKTFANVVNGDET